MAQGVPIAQLSDQLFRSVEGFWAAQVQALGGRYRPAHLSLFSHPLRNRCDVQATLSGPFYCPVDETVYMDQPFLQRLARRAEGGAHFAVGFVMAHEVAHHVQNIIGTTTLVEQARARSTAQIASRSLTAFELQADCYAGLWVHWAAGQHTVTVPADVSGVLDTVAAVSRGWQSDLPAGEEMLDLLAQGSALQRLKWFRRGLDSGRFDDCDTFGAESAGTL